MERTKIVTAATAEEKERLKRILKKGLKSNLTDFAKALQGLYSWTIKPDYQKPNVRDGVQLPSGIAYFNDYLTFPNYLGVRPVIEYSNIKANCYDAEDLGDGITREKYGEYVQSRVTTDELIHICTKVNQGLFKPTGKFYTIHKRNLHYYPFYEPTCNLRKLNPPAEKEVIQLREFVDDEGNKFAKFENGWYKVAPVSLLVDRENNIATTEDIIYSTIPYEIYNVRGTRRITIDKPEYPELEDLWGEEALERIKAEKTRTLRGFIDNVLLKDLIPSVVNLKELFPEKKEDLPEIDEIIKPEPAPVHPYDPWYPYGPNYPFYPYRPDKYDYPFIPYVITCREMEVPVIGEDAMALLKKYPKNR